jgi:putative ABC transport system permease protein
VILGFTALFALVILTSTTTLNTIERTRELATLSCLGVEDATLTGLLLREMIIPWAAAVAVGAPLGVKMGGWLIGRYNSEQFGLELHLNALTLCGAALFSLVICLLALMASLWKIRRIPLMAAVQERMD